MSFRHFIKKMAGTTRGSPPKVGREEIFWSWVGAFLGIAAISLLGEYWLDRKDVPLMIGSFGASAVLAFGAVRSPLAQPRNLIGGHVFSAIVGVACWKLFHQHPWLAQAVAVATAIAVMHMTRTLHPPGGATALIAVIGSSQLHDLGFLFALFPVALGALILLSVALVVNNIPRSRQYPENWL